MRLALAIVCVALAATAVTGSGAGDGAPDRDPVPVSWLDRLDAADRACLEQAIGFAPPAFPADASWLGSEPLTWEKLAGKVVVLQSWSCRSGVGRAWLGRAPKLLADAGDDVVIVAVHTPEGADRAAEFVDRAAPGVPVMVDPGGYFCDALGMYDRPVNVVVDRNGAVRYAGLSSRGLPQAVQKLVQEKHDPQARPTPRQADSAPAAASYPPIEGTQRWARDLRGAKAPPFSVQQWLNGTPDPKGKVVVLDFWATWCGGCRAAIPHMNELAERFGDDVVIIGISDETPTRFQQGLRKYGISLDDFDYYVALDPTRAMSGPIQVRGLPHVMVLSSDWVVRWQGLSLNQATLAQVVEANASGTKDMRQCARWAGQAE